MTERILIRTNVNIYKDTMDTLKMEGIELGSLVRTLLDNYLSDIQILENKSNQLKEQAKQIDSLIELKKKSEEEKRFRFRRLNDFQLKVVMGSIEILSKDNKYFTGRLNYWNNTFEDMKLNPKEFQELLDTYTDEKGVKSNESN